MIRILRTEISCANAIYLPQIEPFQRYVSEFKGISILLSYLIVFSQLSPKQLRGTEKVSAV